MPDSSTKQSTSWWHSDQPGSSCAGHHIGFIRPITLWPFPYEAVHAAAQGVQSVMVFENSAGQLIDDVKIAVEGAAPVVGIGGVSTDSSGFGVGDLYDVDVIRERVLAQIKETGAKR